MPARVVTISATYGAGGTLVAPQVADRLGLPFADRLIPTQRDEATRSGEGATDEETAAQPPSRLAESLGLFAAGWLIPTPTDAGELPDDVRQKVEASIQELVDSGGAVILGRAAAVVLAGRPNAFHVRLDGPEDRRAELGAAWEGVDVETARDHLRRTDALRVRYVRRLYRRNPDEASLYHLVLDSTVLGVDGTTDVVATAAEAFFSRTAT